MTEKKSRVSKAQWLDMALEVFEKEGINGVKIEQLAKLLGVAKSGFYWHFKDRRQLLEQMLEYWEYEYTIVLKQFIEYKTKLTPEEIIFTIMRLLRENKIVRYELAIRAWAETDEIARETAQRAYQIRYNVLKKIFKTLGYKGNKLEARVRLFVVYGTWNTFMFSGDSEKKSIDLEKELLKLFTS